jgi:nicotinate-nucleotide--dimethylbenzimidazole phosphoribosyltransferase
VAAADDAVDAGVDLLLITGRADPDSCALVVSTVTDAEPVAVLPRGAAAVDSEAWIARAVLLRDRRREFAHLQNDPDGLLHAVDEPVLGTAAGAVARAVSRRTPVLLDGDLAVTGALLAYRAQPRSAQWWRIADTSRSPLQRRTLTAFDHRPVLDLGIDTADGLAALLALAALRTAAALALPHPLGGST